MLHWTMGEELFGFDAVDGSKPGMAAGTRVATALGWRPVEALAAGDLVLTFDHGMQPLAAVHRRASLPGDEAVMIPDGALGQQGTLIVAADQAVMTESDLAERVTGDPFLMIEARALIGWRGIAPVQPAPIAMMVELSFDAPEAVFTRSGAVMATEAVLSLGPEGGSLTGRAARAFVARLIREEP
jgi:hypothetical protein